MREQLREILNRVSLVPARECTQEQVSILLGAIGLELYAAYSKLIQLEMEFKHAPEYLENGQRQDVEETMEINGEIFLSMGRKYEKRSQELMQFWEKDRAFCKPVSALLLQLAQEVKELSQCRLGDDADKGVSEYLQQLRDVAQALREYLGLCIGSTTIWKNGEASVSDISGIS